MRTYSSEEALTAAVKILDDLMEQSGNAEFAMISNALQELLEEIQT